MDAISEPCKIYPINKQNALLLQQKSLESRRANKLAREEAERQSKLYPVNFDRIARLDCQLKILEQSMRQENDPDALSKLANAHAKLFSAWQVLTSTPNPGSRRAKSERSRGIVDVAPIQPMPQASVEQVRPETVQTPQS